MVNDIKAIGEAVRAAGHDALLMVDAVASLGCMPFEMDNWGVDVAVAGSQKGLMTPPGLGFTAASPRARAAHDRADLRTPYWDWTFREGGSHYHKYCGTPPEQLLFGLRAALDMIFAEGLDNVFRRHRLLAEATRRAVGVWAEGQAIGFNIAEPAERSDTVTALVARDGMDVQPLVDYCANQCGVVLGKALGALEGRGFPHRPYGPRQRADGDRHAWRGRDGLVGAQHRARQGRHRRGDRLSRQGGAGVKTVRRFEARTDARAAGLPPPERGGRRRRRRGRGSFSIVQLIPTPTLAFSRGEGACRRCLEFSGARKMKRTRRPRGPQGFAELRARTPKLVTPGFKSPLNQK